MKWLCSILVTLVLAPCVWAASAPELLSAGRLDEAVSMLRGRVGATPNDAESWHLLARAYYRLEKWDEAVKAGEKAVQLSPNNSDYHMWLGRMYGEKADHANFITATGLAGKVRQEFERAVSLNGANAAARVDLAEFYMSAPGFLGGGRDKALAQAQTLEAMHSPASFWIKARLAEKDKNWAEAEKNYLAAVQAKGGAQQWYDLAGFYRRMGRYDKMEEAVGHAVTAADAQLSSIPLEAAGLLFAAGRNFNGAIEILRKYLASDGKVEEAPAFRAHYLLGTILEKMGDRNGAANEYRAALALASSYQPAREALQRVTGSR